MSCKCFNNRVAFTPKDTFNTRLNKSKCNCSSRFKVKENRSSFSICCDELELVDKYKIDGYFDSSSTHKKCDYLFQYHSNTEIIIFLELKGVTVKNAFKQIETTISLFDKAKFFEKIKNFRLIGAIVSTQGYPEDNPTFRKLKTDITKKFKKYNLQIELKTYSMQYDPKRNKFMK